MIVVLRDMKGYMNLHRQVFNNGYSTDIYTGAYIPVVLSHLGRQQAKLGFVITV